MPLPPTQPIEARQQRIVRMLPNVADNKNLAAPLIAFIQQELTHWQADLEERQREGEYYLERLDWLETEDTEAGSLKIFLRLVRKEISSLCRLIEQQSGQLRDPDMEQLLSIQQAYLHFCEHYDRIKMEVLEGMDWNGHLQIF